MEMNEDVQAKLDQLAKLPPAARTAIVIGVGVLIAAAYFFLMYQEANTTLTRLHGQEMELQRKLSEVRSITANIAEFEEEIANLEVKLQTVIRQLPSERELEVLLTDISNLGKSAGIEIKSFRRREEVSQGFYAEVPIDLELEGEYHHIARFFDMMASLPRIVNMGSVDVRVASDKLEGTTLRVTGTATTFRFITKGA